MVSAYFERYYNELIDCPKNEEAAKDSRSLWDGTAAKTSAGNLCKLLEHGDDKLIIYAWSACQKNTTRFCITTIGPAFPQSGGRF